MTRTECLPLNGLETLDDETARALARHAGGPLVLNALALAAELSANETPRHVLAAWLTAPDNAWFARAIANRRWAEVFGRGLVAPVDSLGPENLPSHPELLNVLAGELVASGYDFRQLVLGMTLTRAYQRSHRTVPGNEVDTALYSHATIKAVRAEVFYDCLVTASGADLTKEKDKLAVGRKPVKGETLAAPKQGAKAGVPDAAASGSKMGKHGQQEVHEPLVSPEIVMEVLLAGLSSHGQTR